MRGGAWLVAMLLLPLASGWTLSDLREEPNDQSAGEHLLVLPDGVWTSEKWSSLLSHDIQPLRSVRSDALLVWSPPMSSWPEGAAQESVHPATWRSDISPLETGPSAINVLFEPRLPEDVAPQLLRSFEHRGAHVLSASLDVQGNVPASATVYVDDARLVEWMLQLDGVLWIEPVLEAQARNGQAASLMEHGSTSQHPFWQLGLNGSGVVLGVADSGIDADHTCFRNATNSTSPHAEAGAAYPAVGIFGEEHRKIKHMNTSLDDNDTPGHSDYRHGTHVIGSLACHDVYSDRENSIPANGSTLAYASTLVVQDIVSQDGWVPPDADRLLWEASHHGALLHSNSWGDDTTAYTERTGRFDAYARAMPWSLAFIAPGNSGEGVLEPANGRNVVAVSAGTKATSGERWGSTAYGPTEANTDGIFLVAPGANIQSAGADGFWNTNNANLRSSSGTSMATPHATGAAAIVQQLYEQGWIVPAYAPLTLQNISDLQPAWAEDMDVQHISLGEGFSPSNALMRASLAMAASPLPDGARNGGNGGHALHNTYDGWGMLNLSQLLSPSALEEETSPSADMWVHDSYRRTEGSVEAWFTANGGTAGNLSGMDTGGWDGTGSVGPFLRTGEMFTQRLTPIAGEDVRVRMAFPAQPEPAMVDDVQLRVRLDDGTLYLPDRIQGDGTPTAYFGSVTDANNTSAFPSSNETVVGINLPQDVLNGSEFIDIEVVARFVQPGGMSGAVGLDGDAVGFALVVKGVDRDSADHLDDDGDGVSNIMDACPMENASEDDQDQNGCLDDDDQDGVANINDACPQIGAEGYDIDADGCLDDTDGDGITDDVDMCATVNVSWPVQGDGCYPDDNPLVVTSVFAPENGSVLDGEISVGWSVLDADGDGYTSTVLVRSQSAPNITLLTCFQEHLLPGTGQCLWTLPDDLPPFFQRGERYSVVVELKTTNASPAASTTSLQLDLSKDLEIPKTNETASEPDATRTSAVRSPVVLWSFLGVLSGLATAWFMRGSRNRRPKENEMTGPFRGIDKIDNDDGLN